MGIPPIQDLPPQGGYSRVHYKRVPLKPIFNKRFLFGGYVSISLAALYIYKLADEKIRREEIEMRSCTHAIFPLLLAERDRLYLKELRRNRDEEAKLMANVPGWVVGTWFGEPVYKSVPKDTLIDPVMREFYIHTEKKHYLDRSFLYFWF